MPSSLLDAVFFSKRFISRTLPSLYLPLKSLYQKIASVIFSRNLDKLAIVFGTDKYCVHQYTAHYQNHFNQLRLKELILLEIGVGGYKNPREGGNSLRMWKHYFPKSHISGIDIYDKSALVEDRITIFQGSQNDPDFLNSVLKKIGPVDIVIDDGSHINEHVLTSFKVIFPQMSPNGIYVVEDTHTSYLPRSGGDSKHLNNLNTTVGFFKSLADELNHSAIKDSGYKMVFSPHHLSSIHFYKNLVIIKKGENEGSPHK